MIVVSWALAASLAFAIEPSTTTPPVDPVLLVEMQDRKIIPQAAKQWTAEDEALLSRIRRVEGSAAFDLLKEELGSLRGCFVFHGSGPDRVRWMTKAGFERYIFFRSQKARRYFEDQDTDAKIVFDLKTTRGERIFDAQGFLTSAGDDLYNRILQNERVKWVDPEGHEISNSPLQPPPPGSPAEPDTLPVDASQ